MKNLLKYLADNFTLVLARKKRQPAPAVKELVIVQTDDKEKNTITFKRK